MKKYIINLFLLVILGSNLASLYAQEENSPGSFELRKFGLGLNLEKNVFDSYYLYYAYPPSQFTFSLNIKDKVRIEPEAGFSFRRHYDDDDESEEKNKIISVGIGAYGLTPKGPICIIYGCQLIYLHHKYNYDYTTYESVSSANGISFGPVVGLDYIISAHFTIGADFKLLYRYQLTKYDSDTQDNVVSESSYKYLETIAGLKFRFYF